MLARILVPILNGVFSLPLFMLYCFVLFVRFLTKSMRSLHNRIHLLSALAHSYFLGRTIFLLPSLMEVLEEVLHGRDACADIARDVGLSEF